MTEEELEKENAEMKKQITKAKEIIKKFSEFVNNEVELDPTHPQEYTDLWLELCEKAVPFVMRGSYGKKAVKQSPLLTGYKNGIIKKRAKMTIKV